MSIKENTVTRMDPKKPLITFALFAYNQERFIREAIDGAFSQNYSPLQIILSDDCSDDKTFEIMETLAEAYRGPHEILLNRNQENLGIGSHINRIVDLTLGELIVIAAGDDVSLPNRVAEIVNFWAEHNYEPMSIHSSAIKIDEKGHELGLRDVVWFDDWQNLKLVIARLPPVGGSTHAWNVEAFRQFGPLSPSIVYEDKVIPFRMALIGKVGFIPKPLIKYRVHVGVTGHYGSLNFNTRLFGPISERELRVAEQVVSDLKTLDVQHSLLPHARRCVAKRKLAFELGKNTSQVRASLDALKNGLSILQVAKLLFYFHFPTVAPKTIAYRQAISKRFANFRQ